MRNFYKLSPDAAGQAASIISSFTETGNGELSRGSFRGVEEKEPDLLNKKKFDVELVAKDSLPHVFELHREQDCEKHLHQLNLLDTRNEAALVVEGWSVNSKQWISCSPCVLKEKQMENAIVSKPEKTDALVPMEISPGFRQVLKRESKISSSLVEDKLEENDVEGVQSLSPCHFYLRGQCRRGDKCRFLHSMDDVKDGRMVSMKMPSTTYGHRPVKTLKLQKGFPRRCYFCYPRPEKTILHPSTSIQAHVQQQTYRKNDLSQTQKSNFRNSFSEDHFRKRHTCLEHEKENINYNDKTNPNFGGTSRGNPQQLSKRQARRTPAIEKDESRRLITGRKESLCRSNSISSYSRSPSLIRSTQRKVACKAEEHSPERRTISNIIPFKRSRSHSRSPKCICNRKRSRHLSAPGRSRSPSKINKSSKNSRKAQILKELKIVEEKIAKRQLLKNRT